MDLPENPTYCHIMSKVGIGLLLFLLTTQPAEVVNIEYGTPKKTIIFLNIASTT